MQHPPRTPAKLTRANTCTTHSYNIEKIRMGKPGGRSRSTLWWQHTHIFACTMFVRTDCHAIFGASQLWLQHINMAEYYAYTNIYFKCAEKDLAFFVSNASTWKKRQNGTERVSNVTEMNWNCHCSNLRLDLESKRLWVGHVTKATISWTGENLIVRPLM